MAKKAVLRKTAELVVNRFVVFGSYGLLAQAPITWKVLRNDGLGALLLSQGILCVKSYDSTSEAYEVGCNNWKASTLRHWLNSEAAAGAVDFGPHPPPDATHQYIPDHWEDASGEDHAYDQEQGFLAYFTEAERAALQTVSVETPPRGRTQELEVTADRVFLPGTGEVDLLGYKDLAAELTEQARADLEVDSDDAGWGWWLRLPRFTGSSDDQAAGEVEEGGHSGFWSAAAPAPGVRPALVIAPGTSFEGSGMRKNPYRFVG